MKSYIVTGIIEADFGCEGLPDGEVIKSELKLKDEEGNVLEIEYLDGELIAKGINEGDRIHFTDSGEIVKEE